MPFSRSISSQRARMCQGLCFPCLYLYWDCPLEGPLIDRCSGCCLLISLDLHHINIWHGEPPFLLLWMSSWLVFLTWSCCGHFLCDCVFSICLCCFSSFPYPPGSIFWNLPSCLYPFSQIHAPFHSFSMWLLGRDALHLLTLPPLSDPDSDFAASNFFISL